MSSVPRALELGRVLDSDATLRLLRAENLPLIAATLGRHLGAPGTRMLSDELFEAIDTDLDELRPLLELPGKSAKAYCNDWRNAGFLIRRPADAARGETYELSPDAVAALQILARLDDPPSTVTESRLVSLAASVRQLAIDTDPDARRRLELLAEERDRIEAEMERIRHGEDTTIDPRRALERVVDVVQQARDIPADFSRVLARFDELNHDLRARILDAEGSRRTVLDDVFRGVDLIQSSDEGLTFAAFSELIRDPERSAALESDLAAVLDREFASGLDAGTRRFLRGLIRQLGDRSREVQGVLTEFARGLRRYVFSQEFQRDLRLRASLNEALAAALPASRRIRPYADAGVELDLTAVRIASVGELLPHDPSDFDTGEPLTGHDVGATDLAALVALSRETEIDFAELIRSVGLAAADGPVTVGEVLSRYPATQGVASVLGLLSLAALHGEPVGGTESLTWRGTDGRERAALVATHRFTGRIDG